MKPYLDWMQERGWSPGQQKAVLKAIQRYYENEEVFECADNLRLARMGNDLEVGDYFRLKRDGCCGFFDIEIDVPGESTVLFGFNYGH